MLRQLFRLGRCSSVVFQPSIGPRNLKRPSQILSHPISTTAFLCKKGNQKKKGNENKKAIDQLLEELSDDEDEDVSETNPDVAFGNPNSPVKAFLKNKVKSKSKGGWITYEEAQQFVDVDGLWKELEDILQDQKNHFIHHITLRSASAIDELPVEFEGEIYPLREIAEVSKSDPKRVIIDSSSIPQATKNIMVALQSKKTMNLNPQQDGTRIYVQVPKVTKEARQNLAKSAQVTMNETLEKLRKVCNKKIAQITDAAQSGALKVSQDHVKGVQDLIRAFDSHFGVLCKEMTDKKQKELLNK